MTNLIKYVSLLSFSTGFNGNDIHDVSSVRLPTPVGEQDLMPLASKDFNPTSPFVISKSLTHPLTQVVLTNQPGVRTESFDVIMLLLSQSS
ncbi:MAG: hypothetical protein JWM21_4323 [Acidobacteria bacterium]|nr:hypothetical protein [Acidobacteriota bacterium]